MNNPDLEKLSLIQPDWPAPDNIKACTTTRQGGVSRGEFAGFNLAAHVDDQPEQVRKNRQILSQHLDLPAEPCWLEQVHGVQVVNAAKQQHPVPADASYSFEKNVVCCVMTADCLPILICDRQGEAVAAAHAGWRGLHAGVMEATIDAMVRPVGELLVWMGPAIGPEAFEVGEEVRQAFIQDLAESEAAFKPSRPGHWMADIYQLARLRLQRKGVEAIFGGHYCTYNDDRFYSYRQNAKTGRMASLIWREK